MENEQTAFEVESSIIDLLTYPLMEGITKSLAKMVNEVSGHHQFDRGIKTIDELELFYAAKPLEIAEGDYPLFVSLNKTYGRDVDLYEATHKAWVISEWRIPKITHVLGVHNKIVRVVYIPEKWQHSENGQSKRWEFIGREDMDSPYLNKEISNVASFGRGNAVAYMKSKK